MSHVHQKISIWPKNLTFPYKNLVIVSTHVHNFKFVYDYFLT